MWAALSSPLWWIGMPLMIVMGMGGNYRGHIY